MNSRNPKEDKLIRTNIKQNKRGETISGAVGQRFESSLAYISSFYGRLSLFNLPYNGFWSKYLTVEAYHFVDLVALYDRLVGTAISLSFPAIRRKLHPSPRQNWTCPIISCSVSFGTNWLPDKLYPKGVIPYTMWCFFFNLIEAFVLSAGRLCSMSASTDIVFIK